MVSICWDLSRGLKSAAPEIFAILLFDFVLAGIGALHLQNKWQKANTESKYLSKWTTLLKLKQV